MFKEFVLTIATPVHNDIIDPVLSLRHFVLCPEQGRKGEKCNSIKRMVGGVTLFLPGTRTLARKINISKYASVPRGPVQS